MFSKRILFTYTSPYINNCIDINEYDRVRVCDGVDRSLVSKKELC